MTKHFHFTMNKRKAISLSFLITSMLSLVIMFISSSEAVSTGSEGLCWFTSCWLIAYLMCRSRSIYQNEPENI